MKRVITMFCPQLDNHSKALISQVLGSAPEQLETRETCEVWRWESTALVCRTELNQIKADADFLILDDGVDIKLACFDMDSTLIRAEVIDELAAELGIKEQVAAITESAMRGEIDFKESFSRRLALLKGLDVACLESVFTRISLMPGARRLMSGLRERGIKTAILSGGFNFFAERVATELGMDVYYANELAQEGSVLTGVMVEPIVDAEFKLQQMKQLAAAQGILSANVLAVGDGANDLPMLQGAGVGCAYHAKPKVQAAAPFAIRYADLSALLVVI